jgi:hypothetical protein
MESDWTSISSSNQLYEVELIKGMLETNGIESVIVSKFNSIYMIGEFELHVQRQDVIQAKTLINYLNQ